MKQKPSSNKSVANRKYNFSQINIALLSIAIIIHITLAFKFNFTQDDAYITFRYVENFVNGDGLVFNIGERVEGYTNFLWTLLLILGRLAGLELVMLSRILGVICGAGTILVLYFLSGRFFSKSNLWRGMVCLLFGSSLSFAYWSIAGLETAAFTLALTASIYLYIKRSYMFGPVAVLATLLRPEGILVFAILLLYDIIYARKLSRYLLVTAAVYILSLLPFGIFKLYYYGGLLPNTFYAKAGFTSGKLLDGLEYAGRYFWHYLGAGLFLIPAVIALKKKRLLLVPAVFVLAYVVYIVFVGGDVLKVHRFFVPLMPLMALLVTIGVSSLLRNRIIAITSIVLVVAWQSWMPFDFISTYHNAELHLTRKMDIASLNLKRVDESNFTVAVSTIGKVGHNLIGHRVIDMLGLTDTTIARHPEDTPEGMETTWKERHFNTPYLLSRQPDYILFSTGPKPSAPAERALYQYSSFLRNYRTIAFFDNGIFFNIFKRYYPIDKENIVRDVDIRFVQLYNKAFNMKNARDFQNALVTFNEAAGYLPDQTMFPYVYYYMADCLRHLKRGRETFELLDKIVKYDTLVFHTYRDLYYYEALMHKDSLKAKEYHDRIKSLMPWYIKTLDSLIANYHRR